MFGYFIIVGGTMLFGWATMILVTPNKEQVYKDLSIYNPSQLNQIKKQNEKVLKALQEGSKSQDPIWKVKIPGSNSNK